MIDFNNPLICLFFFLLFTALGFILGYTVKALFQNQEHLSGLQVIDEWLEEAMEFRKETEKNLNKSRELLMELKERGT